MENNDENRHKKANCLNVIYRNQHGNQDRNMVHNILTSSQLTEGSARGKYAHIL